MTDVTKLYTEQLTERREAILAEDREIAQELDRRQFFTDRDTLIDMLQTYGHMVPTEYEQKRLAELMGNLIGANHIRFIARR